MEEILYRNTKIPIKTIPKGTLLFRIVENPEDDFRGVKLEDGTRCIIPNYNVFFYPNPFMGNISIDSHLQETQQTMYVYKLVKDVKVISLISPSKYSRRTRNTKRNFIKKCSNVPKGCMPRPLADYDPCLSDTIIKKYPDVVGIISIAISDNKRAKKRMTQKLKKYFKETTDARGISGVPEIMLHPLTVRPSSNVIVHDKDVLENNYEQVTKFSRFDIQRGQKFMDQHAIYNPDTFFYTYTA
jgi:hypothetical protein